MTSTGKLGCFEPIENNTVAEKQNTQFVFCPGSRGCGWTENPKAEVNGHPELRSRRCHIECVVKKYLTAVSENTASKSFLTIVHEGNEFLIANRSINTATSEYFKVLLRFPSSESTNGVVNFSHHKAVSTTVIKQVIEFLSSKLYRTDHGTYGHIMLNLIVHCEVYAFAYRILYQELMDASYNIATSVLDEIRTKHMIGEGNPICYGTFWEAFEAAVRTIYENIEESGPARLDKMKETFARFFGYIMEKRKHLADEYAKSSYERITENYPKLARDTLVVMDSVRDN